MAAQSSPPAAAIPELSVRGVQARQGTGLDKVNAGILANPIKQLAPLNS